MIKQGIYDPRRPTEIIREFEEEEEKKFELEAIKDPRRPTEIIKEFEREEEMLKVMQDGVHDPRRPTEIIREFEEEEEKNLSMQMTNNLSDKIQPASTIKDSERPDMQVSQQSKFNIMDHTPYPPDDLKPNSSNNPFLPDIGSNKKQKYKQDEISLN